MCREFYSIGSDEIGKFIRYHGFLWKRDNADDERGPDGELLDYAFTYGDIGNVYLKDIAGDPFAAITDIFDVCQQYQSDISEGSHFRMLNNYYREGYPGERLHMSDVCESTPCGDYFFDNGSDEPGFTYIPSKAYANDVTDPLDDLSAEFLARCCERVLGKGAVRPDSEVLIESSFEITREVVVPILERLGLSVRPDDASF